MRVKKDTFVQLISNAKKAINKSTIESFEAIKMEVNGDILKQRHAPPESWRSKEKPKTYKPF